ncbi:TonB-dependent receptor [Chromobacterium sp. F49]|uniref:TonB-dependent receptor plug domain-containing protein n=1 Tax=Chromobacterium TaxID=535 RepID=UPI0005BD0CA0|nr:MULTISPECIES: TonB-dependent receptor [Chromobacterium]KUM01665.1 TonB-dependent receptor [Chromobacterium subtsugae]KZE84538.1 TonB-dependent receptor [Chromobacterium sp. F49]WSE90457.1 TonB-dependent receptor [Chromobacterium subtsugae]WVH58829.1 TonB-dependent receptor [Chromobacterium subtsugae]
MMKHTLLLAGLGAALPIAALAADSAPQDNALERVTVTGSNLRASSKAKANPVQVISAADIASSGKTSLPDVLRSLAVNSGNSFNEQYTGSFSAGTAGISLRGLGQRNTLILVNGKRVANYATAQELQETFVDLNSLPLKAVKRIEILKDGASAIYGSDAIAGVVNIILYPDYQGAELGASASRDASTGQNERLFNLLAGKGDLERDGYNVWFSFDAQKRDRLDQTDVSWLKDNDFRNQQGGSLVRNVTNYYNGAPTQRFPNAAGPLQDIDYGAVNPGKSGRVWAYNPALYTTLMPGIERYHAALRGSYRLNAGAEAYAEFLYGASHSNQIFGPPLTISSSLRAWNSATQSLVPISNVLPVGNPGNPNATPTPINATLFDLGQRNKTDSVSFRRLLAGVKGSGDAWDWDVSGLYSDSRLREYAYNFVNRYAYEALLANGGYNFADPSQNNDQARNSLRINTLRPAWYRTASFDATASTELGQLPAGPLGFAAGYQLRREMMNAGTSPEVASGAELRPALDLINGARTVQAAYGELNAPIVKNLSLSAAARADHYSDFGSAFSPKLGLRYQPLQSLTLRGTLSKGFRAPSLPEITHSTAVSYGSVQDPYDPITPNQSIGFTHLVVANPAIKPEHSTNANLGLVLSPTADSSIAIDYYRIRQKDVIGLEDIDNLVRNPGAYPGQIVRDSQGRLQTITQQFTNLGNRETTGFDLDLRQSWKLGGGRVTLAAQWSRLLSFRQPLQQGGALREGAGSNLLGALPRWKGQTSANWDSHDWSSTLTWFHTDGYTQAFSSGAGDQTRVGSANTFNLSASYKGIKRATLTAALQNLSNRRPPWDSHAGIYYDSSQYDPTGRTLTLGVQYKLD